MKWNSECISGEVNICCKMSQSLISLSWLTLMIIKNRLIYIVPFQNKVSKVLYKIKNYKQESEECLS